MNNPKRLIAKISFTLILFQQVTFGLSLDSHFAIPNKVEAAVSPLCQDAENVIDSIYSSVSESAYLYALDQRKDTAYCDSTTDIVLAGGGSSPKCDDRHSDPVCGRYSTHEKNEPIVSGSGKEGWRYVFDSHKNGAHEGVRTEAVCLADTSYSQFFDIYTVQANSTGDELSFDQNKTTALCNPGDTVITGRGAAPRCNTVTDPACLNKLPQTLEFNGPVQVGSQEGWKVEYDIQNGNNIPDTIQTTAVCMHKTSEFDNYFNLYKKEETSLDTRSLGQDNTQVFCERGDIAIGGGGHGPRCDNSSDPICGYNQYIEYDGKTGNADIEGWRFGLDVLDVGNYSTQSVYVTCLGLNQCPALPQADLEITKGKSGDPDSVTQGENTSYVLTVKNNGPDTAENVIVTDVLPAGINYVASSLGCSESNGTVTCDFGDITNQQLAIKSIMVGTSGLASCGPGQTVTNTANISSSTLNINSNNSSTLTSDILCPLTPASLNVVKNGPSLITKGDLVTYTIDINNSGQETANNVVVVDSL
ncbi:DUF11 domain-containing protein, partial [Candidatus Peribacteria bacterium]|nr:DUF11 domain-containing protein [Candidatus Peribacteria bacterium]MBT4021252.1 DUF11 domain-containing protein [Candidatus Peribacteria bacterium]MBT4240683.1 DUF11 domain-containing protein [Candidatus Peribacteria bacterium]MBT4474028.1 DUF11 domain-containing protein [Candidatus Peribacteria bacterium]